MGKDILMVVILLYITITLLFTSPPFSNPGPSAIPISQSTTTHSSAHLFGVAGN